uniref:Uncharacterized protein n=1 Tax=uncultured prokaryote TaxID=198431 RepID=A0A0H5QP19_9ZZZZ|nr:hypothetical protein [uncultured prokaryote]
MTYSQPFLRLVVIGKLYGIEDFSYSLSLIENGLGPGVTPEEVPQEIIDAVATFSATAGLMSAYAKVTTVKLNLIGEDGRYVNEDTVQHDYLPYPQGAVGDYPPPQVALVYSIGTDYRRGRAHAGRFYMPLPGSVLTNQGTMGAGDQGIAADAGKTFLDDLNDAIAGYSVGVTSNVGAGTQRIATSVRVGRVYDTIRSRRDKFTEEYIEHDLA